MNVRRLILLAALAATTHPASAAQQFTVTKLRDNVFTVMRGDPPGLAVESNAGFIECADHVIVVDAQSNDATTSQVLAQVRLYTNNKPVRHLINTHWHDDHIVGTHIYKDAFPEMKAIGSVASVAYLPNQGKKNREQFHRAIPEVLERFRKTLETGKTSAGKPLSDEQRRSLESDLRLGEGYATVPDDFVAILPDIAVHDKYSIRDKGCAVDVIAIGNAHTTGDLVVYLPEQSVAFVGDIVGWPVPLVGAEQSRVRDWAGTLKRVRDLKAAVVVPGHGPLMRDNAQIDRMIDLMDRHPSACRRRAREGRFAGRGAHAHRSQRLSAAVRERQRGQRHAVRHLRHRPRCHERLELSVARRLAINPNMRRVTSNNTSAAAPTSSRMVVFIIVLCAETGATT